MINCNVPLTRVWGKLYDVSSGFVPVVHTAEELFLPRLLLELLVAALPSVEHWVGDRSLVENTPPVMD